MGDGKGFHEDTQELSSATRDMHRALVSLQEELEAVDWYQQRADACKDESLRAILLHNMREEIEHACMVLEWLRRRHPVFHEHMKTYLFKDGDITEIEAEATGDAAGNSPSSRAGRRTTVGSLGRDR